MPNLLHPRAFISYRHIEYEEGAEADALNLAHRAWVERLVRDLHDCGVEAIYDGHLREMFRPLTTKDPYVVPFLAEVSTITCLVCHAFVPILTPSYIDRLGYSGYRRQEMAKGSFVLEEWRIGMFYANAGVMQYVPIVRAGEPEGFASVAELGVGPENGFDMRDPADYAPQVEFIAERIIRGWDGDDPLITLGLADWIRRYIQWCRRHDPRCTSTPIDEWHVDLLRPRMFLAEVMGGAAARVQTSE